MSIGVRLLNGDFLDLANLEFECPYCNKIHNDYDEKLNNKMDKNKCGYTKIKCDCGEKIGVSVNMMGDMVGFKLK